MVNTWGLWVPGVREQFPLFPDAARGQVWWWLSALQWICITDLWWLSILLPPPPTFTAAEWLISFFTLTPVSVTFTVSPSPSHSCWWGKKTSGSLEEYSKLREWQGEGPDPGPGPECWKRMRKQGEGSQRGTHVGIFQIRKLTVGFDFFLCLYPLIQFFLKCSDTFLILVTSSPLPSLLYEIDSSQSLRSSVFSLPRSVLHLLLVSLLHHRWFPSLPSSMASRCLSQHYPMELSTMMEMSYNLC